MNGTETAFVQIGSIVITTGSVAAVMKWLVPFIIRLYFEKKQENALTERRNIAMSIEREELRKRNSDLELGRLDALVQLHGEQIKQSTEQGKALGGRMQELETALRHTDGHLEAFLLHKPTLEKVASVFESIKKKSDKDAASKRETGAVNPYPSSEQVVLGPNAVMIKSGVPKPDDKK